MSIKKRVVDNGYGQKHIEWQVDTAGLDREMLVLPGGNCGKIEGGIGISLDDIWKISFLGVWSYCRMRFWRLRFAMKVKMAQCRQRNGGFGV